MRLIDADELKIEIEDEMGNRAPSDNFEVGMETAYTGALAMIDAAPTIGAGQRGYWDRVAPSVWECSACRATQKWTPDIPKARYCQGCGAKMDGGNGNG